MNRRNLIKTGIAAVGSALVPDVVNAAIPVKISPPKIHTLSDIDISWLGDTIILINGSGFSISQKLEKEDKVHINDYKDYLIDEFNRRYYRDSYLVDAKNVLPQRNLEIDMKQVFHTGSDDFFVFLEELVINSEFVVATPKVSTVLQLRKNFAVRSISDIMRYSTFSTLHIVGNIKDTPIYRDVNVESDYQEYLLTDSTLYLIDFKMPIG